MARRRITLFAHDTLGPGEHTVVSVEGNPILIANLTGELVALQGTCSHEQYSLQEGWIDGSSITCPVHQSRFDLRTGEVLDPPAVLPLVCYSIVVDDGQIFLEVEDEIRRNE